ncbi:Pre-rRNA-processing protein esf1 [Hondaea fermentalgiana]|uniref:Pre-rRNA-processing protein esf1 n=1 Tax=Hondaea fermentalgiana TaxID=2315210 RepID=A0A2R5GCQ6_9STRA|nr:Pre-rRNA-processing protein esf1 [Hondaea fermentalgiana]|eukprot:GBG28345.1 Pre-rRNA-processing protein esf1 [Hondaea fermentalgiana]
MAREGARGQTPATAKSSSTKKKSAKKQTPRDAREQNVMDEINDDRFKEVQYSAKFARNAKDSSKVRIDSRFKQIFEDEDFVSGAGPRVDKYGRKLSKKERAPGADLKRYYKLESDDEEDQDDAEESGQDEDVTTAKAKPSKKTPTKTKSKSKAAAEIDDASDDRLAYLNKLARGEVEGADSDSDSDSDSSISSFEDLENAEEEEEEEEDIPVGDSTSRIAVQNLDWSRLRAQDILVALQSFLPVGGVIRSVTVYQSEFGEKRLQEEEMHGPRVEGIERRTVALNDPTDFELAGEQEANEGADFDMEKLRKYELDKLKYYFAIVEFNSVEAADHVYKECDGVEFERSSITFDLRFVPDGLEIERPVRDRVTDVSEDYRAPDFITKALQSTKVQLTWDEEDHDRLKLRKWRAKSQKGKEETVIGERELEAFIASSSDEDEEDEEEEEDEDEEDGHDVSARAGGSKKMRKKAAASRGDAMAYRASLRAALLASDSEDDDEDDDNADEVPKKKKSGAAASDEDFDHEYVFVPEDEEKGATKKNTKKNKKQQQQEEEKQHDVEASANDGFNDTFFASESKKSKRKSKAQKQKEEQEREDDNDSENEEIDEDARRKREQAELELLLLSEQDRKKGKGLEGFDYKAIVEGERLIKKKSKLRGKKRERKEEAVKAAREDDFQVDTSDARFNTLYDDPDFAVDRTNSQYKDTRGMRAFEDEQLRKRGAKKALQRRGGDTGPGASGAGAGADNTSDRLQTTVESIKRRAKALEQAKASKKKKFAASK